MARQTLHSDPYVTAVLETESDLLLYTRSDVGYPTLDALRAQHATLTATLATMAPEKLALLIDLRAAKARNDPAFENEITSTVGPMFSRFRACAFLVKTAVGSLQLRRLSTASGAPANAVFTDEAAAREYLSRR
jgi:hypothetical protein